MKRRAISILAAAMLAITLNGCISINYTDAESIGLVGSGERITQEYTVSPYSSLYVNADVELVYTKEPSGKIVVESYENILEHMSITSESGLASIESDRSFHMEDGKNTVVYVGCSDLDSFVADSAVIVREADPISTDRFHLGVNGACDIRWEMDVNHLGIFVEGAAQLQLSGSADYMELNMAGAGTFDGLNFPCKDVDVLVDGIGVAMIKCSDNLDATIDGLGTISYYGNPNVTQRIEGFGTVTKAG